MSEAARNALLSEISAMVEAEPYTVYGHYDDSLSEEQIGLLLESRQAFEEAWWEVEINAADYADWSDLHKKIIATFGERIMALWPDDFAKNDEVEDLEWRDMPDDVQETFRESEVVDCSDLLKTCLRNASRNHFVAVPMDPDAPDTDGDGIGPPNGDLSEEDNEARQHYLADKFGIDGWKAESCYYHESLKVMGRLDLEEVYEKGQPVAVEISPQDRLIFHTSWNGSGCLGPVEATKTVTLPAKFKLDSGSYGIDSVYGFVGEVWANDITVAEWKEWE